MSRTSYRSVFVSDVHLGLADCQAVFLLDFLHSMRCERLYLVGDIVDLENMARRPYWHASHGAVVAEVIAIAARGTRVTYIPGNHDAPLRQLAGQRIAGIDFALDATHVAADGLRYHVSHGDEFDAHGSTPAWLLRLGDTLQGVVCALNRRCNRLLRICGFDYRPLSIGLKARIGAARRFIHDFGRRVAEQAGREGTTAPSAATSISPRCASTQARSISTTATGSNTAPRSSNTPTARSNCCTGPGGA